MTYDEMERKLYIEDPEAHALLTMGERRDARMNEAHAEGYDMGYEVGYNVARTELARERREDEG